MLEMQVRVLQLIQMTESLPHMRRVLGCDMRKRSAYRVDCKTQALVMGSHDAVLTMAVGSMLDLQPRLEGWSNAQYPSRSSMTVISMPLLLRAPPKSGPG